MMNTLLKLLIKGIPGVLAKFFVALAGPTIRALKLLRGDELSVLLGYVALLFGGGTPTYVVLGTYTVDEVQDLSESLRDTLVFFTTTYQVTLTDAELAILVSAISTRLLQKYPVPPAAPAQS